MVPSPRPTRKRKSKNSTSSSAGNTFFETEVDGPERVVEQHVASDSMDIEGDSYDTIDSGSNDVFLTDANSEPLGGGGGGVTDDPEEVSWSDADSMGVSDGGGGVSDSGGGLLGGAGRLAAGGQGGDMDEGLIEPSSDPRDILDYKMSSNNRVIIGLTSGSQLFFKGCQQIKVLKGEVCVQGYVLRPSTLYHKIYSPRGHSLLGISATISRDCQEEEFFSLLSSEGLDESGLPRGEVLLIAKHLSEPWMDFLKKNLKKSDKINLFGRDSLPQGNNSDLAAPEECLDISISGRPGQARLWRKGEDWDLSLANVRLLTTTGQLPRLLVTGGKGVGKSSFARWMTNQLVQLSGRVLFLDLDPGQKEFGLPGYLTATIVDSPLLGPNFCHKINSWERSIFFGDVNVSKNAGRYISCVSRLLKMSAQFSDDLPIVVNTMGWCQGLGAMLNTDVIRLIQPTTVVQLRSRFPRKNFPCSLSPEYVSSTKSSWRKSPKSLSYTLLEFEAVPERRCAKDMRSQDSWGIPEPKVLRDIQMLSWFGRTGGIRDLPVYSIPFSEVGLCVVHERVPSHSLLAALAFNPVDLCNVEEALLRRPKHSLDYCVVSKPPITESIGTGIVRGVDRERRLIYVASNVDEDRLKEVNCLVGGSLALPSGLLSRQKVPTAFLEPSHPDNPLHLPWQRNKRYGQYS